MLFLNNWREKDMEGKIKKFNSKKSIAIFMIMIFCIGLIFAVMPNMYASANNISSLDQLRSICKTGGTCTLTGNITVNDDQPIAVKKNVVITGGYSVKRGDKQHRSLFDVSDGAKLTLKNCTIDGDGWTNGTQTGKYGEALINSRGTVVLDSGATMQDNFNLYDNSGTSHTINGITYPTKKYDESTSKISPAGSAIYSINGKVIVNNGATIKNMVGSHGPAIYAASGYTSDNVVINGGSICNNSAFQYGGAIFAGETGNSNAFQSTGLVNIYGGEIYNNTARYTAGGVWIGFNGTLYMEGGTIRNNTVLDTSGGGVHVNGGEFSSSIVSQLGYSKLRNGWFIMNGGTIRDNKVISANGNGGGVSSSSASDSGQILINKNAVISGNSCQKNGGGIFCNQGGYINMYGGTISGNSANKGGGIYLTHDGLPSNVFGGTISNNNAEFGGGICSYRYGNNGGYGLNIHGGTIEYNTASSNGGGVHSGNNSRLYCGASVIKNNKATSKGGGVSIGSIMLFDNTTIELNTANKGGGIYGDEACALTAKSGKVTNNTATNGGGLYFRDNSKKTQNVIENAEITNNTASGNGGGIFNNSRYTTTSDATENGYGLSITGSAKIDSNKAANGGGIYNTGSLYSYTGVISNNSATYGGGVYSSGTFNEHGTDMTSWTTITSNNATYGGGAFLGTGSATLGNAIVSNTATTSGGGVYCNESSSLIVTECADISSNIASANGGGITAYQANISLMNGKISSNQVLNDDSGVGGGISLYGDKNTLNITNIDLNNNTSYNGAGIYIDTSTVKFYKGNIHNNKATNFGGGIYNNNGSLLSNKTLDTKEAKVNDNISEIGGGIFNNTGTVNISSFEIKGNAANASGGGVYFNTGSNNTIANSTISNNTAKLNGAGICTYMATAKINNSTVSSNKVANDTDSKGGGIANYFSNVSLSSTTVDSNTSTGNGSGIYYCKQDNHDSLKFSGETIVKDNNTVYLDDSAYITVRGFSGDKNIRAVVEGKGFKEGRVIAVSEDGKGTNGLYWNPDLPNMDEQYFKVKDNILRAGNQGAADTTESIKNSDIFISKKYNVIFNMNAAGLLKSKKLLKTEHIINNKTVKSFADSDSKTSYISPDIIKYWNETLTFNPGHATTDGYAVFELWTDKQSKKQSLTQFNPDEDITVKGETVNNKDFNLYAQWKSVANVYYDGNGATGGISTNGLFGWYDKNVDLTEPYTLQGNENSFTRVENKSSRKVRSRTVRRMANNNLGVTLYSFEGWADKNNKPMKDYSYNDIVSQKKMINYYDKNTKLINFYATWDEYPTITADDRWFTLDEAKTGKITLENLMSTAKAVDGKTGQVTDFEKGEGTFKIYDYKTQAEADKEFKSFTTSGTTTITYVAVDKVGNEAVKTVTVHIVDKDQVTETTHKYVTRFISAKYYKDKNGNFIPEEKGGFHAKSPWVTKEDYIRLLTKTFENKKDDNGKWDNVYQSWTVKSNDIPKVREYVDKHGLGNSKEKDGLKNFITQFRK